jgi:glyoxylase-like metal-dependent hydrolase (beta-lactamase superfamily II)
VRLLGRAIGLGLGGKEQAVVVKLSEHVVRLGSPLVNWYLLAGDGGVTVVDAGAPGYRDQLGPGCRELGREESDVAAVVLTHAHSDHVGVAEQLRSELDVPVYVHHGDETLATTAKPMGKNESSMFPYLRHAAAWKLTWELARNGGLKPRPIKEVRTFDDGAELDVPGRLRVVHTPGHTDGHCVLVPEAAGVAFAGDAVVSYNPLTGATGPQLMPRAFTRSVAQALGSLDRLKGLGAVTLLPGHGDPMPSPGEAADEAKRRGPT